MLESYLNLIVERLKKGRKVYLCPAALETAIIAKQLKSWYSVLPSGFCDNDPRKQGKNLQSLPELKIYAFDSVIADESADFLVVSPHHSATIMADLIFYRGLSPIRILNYQPLEQKKTCPFFVHNWIVSNGKFHCCCMEGKPEIEVQQLAPQIALDRFLYHRKKLLDGETVFPDFCQKCYHYKLNYVFASQKLNSFNFSFRGWCNYKCSYCSASQPSLAEYNDKFFLEEYLIELEKRNMINDIFSVLFAVGEPTLNEKRFSLYDYCGEKQYFMDIFSNASVFDESLFKLANHSPVIMRKSVDAGTAETYAKIKGVNRFEKMTENLHRYIQAPFFALNLKYLFEPGINDNETDVMRFVRLCDELKVDFVTPSFSFIGDGYERSEHAKKMFKLLVDELTTAGIFTVSVDTLFSESYHRTYIESF